MLLGLVCGAPDEPFFAAVLLPDFDFELAGGISLSTFGVVVKESCAVDTLGLYGMCLTGVLGDNELRR